MQTRNHLLGYIHVSGSLCWWPRWDYLVIRIEGVPKNKRCRQVRHRLFCDLKWTEFKPNITWFAENQWIKRIILKYLKLSKRSTQPRTAYSFSGGAKKRPLLKKLLKINSSTICQVILL